MRFALVNQSSVLAAADVAKIAAALRAQCAHIAAPWERKTPTVKVYPDPAAVPADVVLLVLLDNADQAGALGYHDVTPDGRPYARIFAKTILDDGGTVLSGPLSVSACASHEMCEAFCDPGANLFALVDGKGTLVALEASDAVQEATYQVGAVTVSDFLLPAYFNPFAPGPYSHTGAVTKPAPALAKGGYCIAARESGERQVFGTIPAWKHGGRSAQLLNDQQPKEAPMGLSPYLKAIVAFVVAVLAGGVAQGLINGAAAAWVTIVIGALTTAGVFAAKNASS